VTMVMKPMGFIEREAFRDQLRNPQILKKDSTSCIYLFSGLLRPRVDLSRCQFTHLSTSIDQRTQH
jgi:hypothetical protein